MIHVNELTVQATAHQVEVTIQEVGCRRDKGLKSGCLKTKIHIPRTGLLIFVPRAYTGSAYEECGVGDPIFRIFIYRHMLAVMN